MRNTPLKAFAKSALKQTKKTDIDTTWADQIYTKNKIDKSLKKMGHHTEGNLRGKVDTDPGSKEVGGKNRMLGSSEMY
jgi:hypothetical protein